MGIYVNPVDLEKEHWLESFGVLAVGTIQWADVPKGKLPVILIDNGHFTAAGVATCESEFLAFTNPNDRRYKKIYFVNIQSLFSVTGEDFAKIMKAQGYTPKK